MGNAPNGVRPDRIASVEGAGPNGEALTLPLAIKPYGHGTTVGVDAEPGRLGGRHAQRIRRERVGDHPRVPWPSFPHAPS
jgi:hypothetical protein